MKRILLTSTAAVFALAGAAAAEIAFSGEAALGYNDEPFGDNDGFYWDGNLAVSLTQALDNGLTAGVLFDFDFSDTNLGDVLESGGYVLSLTGDGFGLFFGDTSFAAETKWSSAGTMVADSFSEADGETVLRGDATFGDFTASVSYAIADAEGNTLGDPIVAPVTAPSEVRAAGDDLEQLSLGLTGAFGAFNFGAAYQEETTTEFFGNGDFSHEEVFGVFVGGTFAGANVRLAYAERGDDIFTAADEGGNSIGINVSYPFGPVTVGAFYVVEDSDNPAIGDESYGLSATYVDGPISAVAAYEERADGGWRYNVEGSYDIGNGLTAHAGYIDRESFVDDGIFYVAGEYDLGGGATFLVSYADPDASSPDYRDDDEVGRDEYQVGTTVEVSFQF